MLLSELKGWGHLLFSMARSQWKLFSQSRRRVASGSWYWVNLERAMHVDGERLAAGSRTMPEGI